MATLTDTIKGIKLDSHPARPSIRNPIRRVCKEKGCDTVLSSYNKKPKCYVHMELTFYSPRGTPYVRKTEEEKGKRRYKRTFTEEQVEHIADRYSDGEHAESIAGDYGVTKFVIWGLMARAGVHRERVVRRGIVLFPKEAS